VGGISSKQARGIKVNETGAVIPGEYCIVW